MPWGTVMVRTTSTFFSDRAAGLFGGHHNVFVVGQDDDFVAGTLSTAWSRSSVLGFMVCPPETTVLAPRLSKTWISPGPGATTTVPIPLNGSAGGGLLGLAQDKVLVLLLHVLDDDLAQRAQAGPIVEGRAWLWRVDVNFDGLRIAHDQGAVAHRSDGLPDLLDIQTLAVDDELDIVAIAFLAFGVKGVEIHSLPQALCPASPASPLA